MKVYVTMTDTFMSGWGPAEGKVNKFIVECENYDQANIILRNAKKREEMRHVYINTRKPKFRGALESWRHFDDLGGVWKEEVSNEH